MTAPTAFPPTMAAARERIAAIDPAAYARSRNALDGAVSRLSPYITHGFVSLPEVLAGVAAQHPLQVQHKFVQELGWREYFRHVWQHEGDRILDSLHAGLLPDDAYRHDLPADIREARTGVPVIDQAVRSLYADGWLHNHARLWLASYVVHLRKVHWRVGADWLIGHLIDGDLASNHLSWQWVAGTGSSKPYLFNAGNVARFAPPAWHSEGSVLDTSYEALDAIARSRRQLPTFARDAGIAEPASSAEPPNATPPSAEAVAGRDVWLVHPWALGDPPSDLPRDCLVVGWWPGESHSRWAWSAHRRAFVGARIEALCALRWRGDRAALARAIGEARSVQTIGDPHVAALLPAGVRQRPPHRLFPEVERRCPSFSAWWARASRGLRQVSELPGMGGREPAGEA